MMKYLFLLFTFFIPTKLCFYDLLKEYNPSSSSLIAMVPPPDGHNISKMTDKAVAPHGCQVTSKTVFHADGTSTERETLQCTKETKRDAEGRITRQDDMNKGTFASGQRKFFGGSSSK